MSALRNYHIAINRLEVLWRKLEDEGLYVRANTVALALEELKNRTSVPLEPTEAMIEAGHKALMEWDARTGDDHGMRAIWDAMIEASWI